MHIKVDAHKSGCTLITNQRWHLNFDIGQGNKKRFPVFPENKSAVLHSIIYENFSMRMNLNEDSDRNGQFEINESAQCWRANKDVA